MNFRRGGQRDPEKSAESKLDTEHVIGRDEPIVLSNLLRETGDHGIVDVRNDLHQAADLAAWYGCGLPDPGNRRKRGRCRLLLRSVTGAAKAFLGHAGGVDVDEFYRLEFAGASAVMDLGNILGTRRRRPAGSRFGRGERMRSGRDVRGANSRLHRATRLARRVFQPVMERSVSGLEITIIFRCAAIAEDPPAAAMRQANFPAPSIWKVPQQLAFLAREGRARGLPKPPWRRMFDVRDRSRICGPSDRCFRRIHFEQRKKPASGSRFCRTVIQRSTVF